ncbi:MAG: hypothetical protein U0X20_12290 [Caldilineaceae bacterium]
MGDAAAIVSAAVAIAAILIAIWQTRLTRRAVQSQVLISLKQMADEIHYFSGIAVISGLPHYDDFDTYLKEVPEESQRAIYHTVDFLNYVAHTVSDGFLPRQIAWNYYFHGYRLCNENLMPWWLEGVRRDRFQGFTHFEKMCRQIGAISDYTIEQRERKAGLRPFAK